MTFRLAPGISISSPTERGTRFTLRHASPRCQRRRFGFGSPADFSSAPLVDKAGFVASNPAEGSAARLPASKEAHRSTEQRRLW